MLASSATHKECRHNRRGSQPAITIGDPFPMKSFLSVRVFAFIFFLSGATSLIYQVAWMRKFAAVLRFRRILSGGHVERLHGGPLHR